MNSKARTEGAVACVDFYTRIMGMTLARFVDGTPPVMRTGATQAIRSVDVRDPDLNLIEISELVCVAHT
jgi:catechol 2,3-dioxygenase-like lactoylglutathione lyase family enzyme